MTQSPTNSMIHRRQFGIQDHICPQVMKISIMHESSAKTQPSCIHCALAHTLNKINFESSAANFSSAELSPAIRFQGRNCRNLGVVLGVDPCEPLRQTGRPEIAVLGSGGCSGGWSGGWNWGGDRFRLFRNLQRGALLGLLCTGFLQVFPPYEKFLTRYRHTQQVLEQTTRHQKAWSGLIDN